MTGQLPVFSLKPSPADQVIQNTNASASTVIVMVESKEAVERADDIASVDGVDMLLIGSNDLSIELGIPGGFRTDTFRTALEGVSAACKKRGKIMGLAGIYDQPDIHDWAINSLGARFLLCQQDSGFIATGAIECSAAVDSVDKTQ